MSDRSNAPSSDPGGRIVLVAGRVKTPDRPGHHDYLAGCSLLARLLEQTPGVRTRLVRDGWPADEAVLDDARCLVFYTRGSGKQAFLGSAERIGCLQRQVDRGVGIVLIHQAVCTPPELAARTASWVGGAHVPGRSQRGHWRTRHDALPTHPVTQGVPPWRIRDGWLNGIQFVEGMGGVTPLLWSGPRHRGSPAGGVADVVAWTYERPGGGRSFCFTGLDAHSAWSVPGVRQLVVNGVLWCAGETIPAAGAPCAADGATVASFLTPRGGRAERVLRLVRRGLRRTRRRRETPAVTPAGRSTPR